VDIEADDFTMDAACLSETVAAVSDIKAVVVVHLYGQMANMPAILDVARANHLVVIEDCAQAHGASLNGRKAGTWGDFGCFSFYPTKNLGALGDGGAVVANQDELAAGLRALRQYGWDERRESQIAGVNSRLDEIQAAILRVKLKSLDGDNRKRQYLAEQYRNGLHDVHALSLPKVRQGGEHVYHQFVVQIPQRDDLSAKLSARQIATAIHYPLPVHQQAAFADKLYAPLALPVTEMKCGKILSLPMYPELTKDQAVHVTDAVVSVLGESRGS